MILIFLLTFLGISARAEWSHQPSTDKYLDINPLRFTNRAECALDSKKPTKSFFLLADSLNTGKALYRLGENLNKPESFSVEGVRRYRYVLYSLAQTISNRLLSGELPLLKSGYNDFDLALEGCDGERHCPGMDHLLQKLWNQSSEIKKAPKMLAQKGAYAGCVTLKSFSPLEAHLYGVKPDREALDRIGEAVHKHPELMQRCDESLTDDDLKVGVYQIDLRKVNDKEWEQKGFYFWNSFKLYFSWAYRNSPEARKLAGEYANILRQVNLEESALFFSNGCKSMMAPECGKDYLNISSLRSLAQSQGNYSLSKMDYFDTNPVGATGPVINPDQPGVNNDVLSLGEYSKASEWANNFRENLSKTRGFLKLKLTKSVSLMSLIHSNVGGNYLNSLKEHSEKSLGSTDENYKKELYLLCSEYKIALDEQTSFLRKDLMKLKSDTRLHHIANIITEDSLKDLDWLINSFGKDVLKYCEELSARKIWENGSRPPNSSFATWYQEYVFNTVPKEETNLRVVENINGKPFMSVVNTLNTKGDDVLCATPAHCGRKLLSALIDLKAFSEYASGFLTFEDSIKSPNLFNPVSERMVCKSYDPWFKTKKTISDLMQDIFMAAIWGFVPSPVYVDVGIQPKKVVSLNELIKDGKVYYDPRFDKKRIQATLVADFGPLMNAPCALAISNTNQPRPNNYLALEGVTIQACQGRENNSMVVYGPDDINNNSRNGSGCMSCTINLTSIASTASAFNPGIRPYVFLVRGVVRLVQNLRDPHDIPKSWEVKPNSVYRSWRKHGSVYSSCKSKLIKGEECMSNSCEAKLVSSFEQHYLKYVSDIKIYPGQSAELTVKGEPTKFGVDLQRFSCASRDYKKVDFYRVTENE